MESTDRLVRGIGLAQATALNMIDMIGVGPFVTIPLMVATMHGPQAMLGWVLGALLVICDGLVWAELGAALPQAGGPVHYLRAMYGPRVGGWLAFLFVFQLTFSAPLSMASGCIGFAQYAEYLWPSLHRTITSQRIPLPIPGIGTTFIDFTITNGTFLAMATVGTAVILLYRRITIIGKLGAFLWIGVIGTTLSIIFTGLTHFDPSQAFAFPAGAWEPTHAFFTGLGAALLIAVYDYWGYYNVCYLGGEIRDPGRVIPRAILLSIAGVAVLYLTMNVSILGAMPWQEVERSRFIASDRDPRHGDDAVDRVRLGLLAAARVLACPVRRRARRRLLQGIRAGASQAPFSARLPPLARRVRRGLLFVQARRRRHRACRDPDLGAVPGTNARRDGAPAPSARSAAPLPDVAVSGPCRARVPRLRLRRRDAPEIARVHQARRPRRDRRHRAVLGATAIRD
jgi:amino acid transporter